MSQPPSRAEYEKAVDEIHLEIGRAITEWSYIEQWTFDVYSELVAPGPVSLGLSTAFNQVYSFDTKLAMISRLVEHSGQPLPLRQKQFEAWKPLAKRLQRLGQKRNRVAHGSIVSPSPALNGVPVALPVWVPFYDERGYKFFKVAGIENGSARFMELSAKDIAEIRQSFFDAQKPLSQFYAVHLGKSRT